MSEDNNYNYIYLGNDIIATSGFVINGNKTKLTIDGTYNNTKYTYTNNLKSEETVIKASTTNKIIILKNMNIVSSHGYGVVYVPSHPNYSDVVVEYNNINFSGIELSQNYYGTTKIIDSLINAKDTNNVEVKKVYIAFKGRRNIVDVEFTQNKLRLDINMKKGTLNDPLGITRDITSIGHWGNGDYRVEISNEDDIDNVMPLIKQSLKVNKK